jgi:hypothetical protein
MPLTIRVNNINYSVGVWPFHTIGTGPYPESNTGKYNELFVDASLIGGLSEAAKGISDEGAREALQHGVAEAMKAMEKRGAAEKVKITLHP